MLCAEDRKLFAIKYFSVLEGVILTEILFEQILRISFLT
jgi:hypothetical protein